MTQKRTTNFLELENSDGSDSGLIRFENTKFEKSFDNGSSWVDLTFVAKGSTAMMVIAGYDTSAKTNVTAFFNGYEKNWATDTAYPQTVMNPSCGGIGSTMYCVGGRDGSSNDLKNAYSKDSFLGTWIALTDMTYTVFFSGGAGGENDFYLMNGYLNGANANEIYKYNTSLDSWSNECDISTLDAVRINAAVSCESDIISLGAQSSTNEIESRKYTIGSASSSALTNFGLDSSGHALFQSAITYDGDYIYKLTGYDLAASSANAFSQKYNISTDSWSDISDIPSPARYSAGASYIDGRSIVACGGNSASLKDVSSYLAEYDSWIVMDDAPSEHHNTTGQGFNA